MAPPPPSEPVVGPYVPLPWLDGIRSPAFVFPQREHTNTGRAASTSSRRRISVSQLFRPTRHARDLLMDRDLSDALALEPRTTQGQSGDASAERPSYAQPWVRKVCVSHMTLNHRSTAITAHPSLRGSGRPEPDGAASPSPAASTRSNGPAVQRPMTKYACNRHPWPEASRISMS